MGKLEKVALKSNVFNNSIGSPYGFNYPKLTSEEEQKIVAGLFEQLLVFDTITIGTNRVNFALFFLINKLGISTVEKLLDNGYLRFLLWSPILVTGNGKRREDGTIDESAILNQAPLAAGSLSDEDLDPEKNIDFALSQFGLTRGEKRNFIKRTIRHYVIPNGMEFSAGSADLVINAYQNNSLGNLGLPYEKEPNQLDINQRQLLLSLSHKVLETAVLSRYNLKSYENYEHYEICKKNLDNIGKAYHISDNTSEILKIENIPNLGELYLNQHLDFSSVFKIRHLSNARYFRKWINAVGENSNAQEVTREYLKEIKGTNRFFETGDGKIVKNMLSLGLNTALGSAIAGPMGAVAGLGLGLLESFWLESIMKGKNPSMFIEDLRDEVGKNK